LPSQFGRYTLLDRLAIGGMAEVFRAKIVASHGFEKILVIKRILPHLAADRTFVSMFIDEAKLTAQLTHPKIVQILDFGEVGGQYFIALEFIDGFDALVLLRTCAQRRVRMPLHLAVFSIIEVLEALDYAHNAKNMEGESMQLVHRDISPSNIFISRRGDVKLGDFGIAHAQERESKTQAGTLKGKYGYMSPEQVIGGTLDGRSDLFAMGIVLAEMFMGRRLFTAPNDLDVLLMVRDGRTERLDKYCRDLPPALDRIIRKALKKDPGERYQTAAEFRDDLADYLFEVGKRVGPSELRSFVTDLFDPSPAAAARLVKDARPLAEGAAKPGAKDAPRAAAGPASSPPGGAAGIRGGTPMLHPGRSSPPGSGAPVGPRGTAKLPAAAPALQAAVARRDAARDAEAASDPVASAPPPAGAGASALGAALAQPLSVVDLDQWVSDPQSASVRGTGWTPVSKIGSAASGKAKLSGGGSDGVGTAGDGPGAGANRSHFSGTRSDLGRFVSGAPQRPPDSAGDVSVISPMRIFSDLAIASETGLLRFELAAQIKEIFLVSGAPVSVSSSLPGERFGEYLVAKGVLRTSELDAALGMLPKYEGKLGDTLVGLGLLRPLDVFRMLSQQVRDRVIDVFGWSEGTFAFYRGVTNEQEGFPLGLDTFEILGAGVLNLPYELLEQRFSTLLDFHPRANDRARVDPEAFRLGPTPREVLDILDGERTLRAWMSHFTDPGELLTFLRSLYLLVETDLAQFD
jgi:hypothetical protein